MLALVSFAISQCQPLCHPTHEILMPGSRHHIHDSAALVLIAINGKLIVSIRSPDLLDFTKSTSFRCVLYIDPRQIMATQQDILISRFPYLPVPFLCLPGPV